MQHRVLWVDLRNILQRLVIDINDLVAAIETAEHATSMLKGETTDDEPESELSKLSWREAPDLAPGVGQPVDRAEPNVRSHLYTGPS